MKALQILSFLVVAAIGMRSSPSAAQPVTVPCGTAIDAYFTATTPPNQWLDVVGTRLTARGAFGFSSFSMANGYQVATTPLHTAGASGQSTFMASKGSSHYTGPFHEVFPGRGNGDVDRADFWVYRTGAVWLRDTSWSNTWTQLQAVTCYRGPQNQTVIRGYIHVTSWGTDFWTFVVRGNYLI
jgi:hypothetical protein